MTDDRTLDVHRPAARAPFSLVEQPPNFFWARPETLGSSQAEAAAIERDQAPPDRVAEVRAAMSMATRWLAAVDPAGRA